VRGHIEHLKPTYGFIMGEDRISRFFVPTGLERTTLKFAELVTGMEVEFTHIEGERGPRAIEIRVTDRRRGSGSGPGPVEVPVGDRY
jgi:cold shock CspA family protein